MLQTRLIFVYLNMTYDQAEFDIRLEWGLNGVEQLAAILMWLSL